MIWSNSTDAALDEKLGIIAIKVPFVLQPGPSKVQTLIQALTIYPPELNAVGLPLVRRDLRERADCGYDITFSFEGHRSPATADGEEFSLEGTTSDDAIESHPEIDMLVEKYEGQYNESGEKVVFSRQLEDAAGGTRPNPMHGTTTYLVPGLIWTRTFSSQFLPDHIARQLGCIGNPPVGKQGQRPPRLSGTRDWIMVRFRADWRGNIWKCAESWMVSGPNGSVPDVYRYR